MSLLQIDQVSKAFTAGEDAARVGTAVALEVAAGERETRSDSE